MILFLIGLVTGIIGTTFIIALAMAAGDADKRAGYKRND